MKQWRHLTGLLAAAVALTGCTLGEPCGTPEEKTVFRRVAAHLDRDGSEYLILNGSAVGRAFESNLEKAETLLWQDKNIAAEKKNSIQKNITAFRMAAALAGIEQISGGGFSVKTLASPVLGRHFFHSKLFLALPPDAAGVLNSFFLPGEGFSCREVLADMPADISFFAAGEIVPEALLQALKFGGAWGENSALDLMEKFPLQEIIGDLRGYWSWAVANDSAGSFVLTFPDNGGRIKRMLQEESKGIFPGAEIEFPGQAIRVYSSVDAKRYFSGKTLKMRDRRDFGTLLAALPEKGFFCCYQGENFSFEKDFLLLPPPASAKGKLPALLVAARTGDGILTAVNSGSGMVDFGLRVCDFLLAVSGGEEENAPVQTARECSCELLLRKLAASKNISVTPGVAGLREFFNGQLPMEYLLDSKGSAVSGNCRVIYFGKGQAGMPLAISAPVLHQDKFHVLFNDMTLERFDLNRADSCRRIIGFLHTVKRYDEKALQKLMQAAQKFDSELNK